MNARAFLTALRSRNAVGAAARMTSSHASNDDRHDSPTAAAAPSPGDTADRTLNSAYLALAGGNTKKGRELAQSVRIAARSGGS